MMESTVLSKEQINLLRKIRDRGMYVLWSYGSPLYYWKHEDDPSDDMDRLSQEERNTYRSLGKKETITTYISTKPTFRERTTIEIKDGARITRKYYESGDGAVSELIDEKVTLAISDNENQPEKEVGITLIPGKSMKSVRDEWKSPFVYTEHIEMNDYFEEQIGLISEIKLTELGLSVIED